ncbi:MAG: DUF1688 family protein [Rubrivivax sp.]|nr:MAG: DUF1688 family protein [Rubrivivax sp.]
MKAPVRTPGQVGVPSASSAVAPESLLSAKAVRRSASVLMAAAQAGQSTHFTWHPERVAVAAAYVAGVIRERYPDLQVPYHSRWRHFEAGGLDRWAMVAHQHDLDGHTARLERARARIDLVVISVLLDAGAGAAWSYADAETGQTLTRSEGLGVASLRWWAKGALSHNAQHPTRADAQALAQVDAAAVGQALQVRTDNPLVGLEGRADLLRRLSLALEQHPEVYGRPDAPGLLRPGHLVDTLFRQAPTGKIPATAVLTLLLNTLGDIWSGRHQLDGVNLGDCWRHPNAPDGWVPFHKLSQWLTYSLLEPLEDAGLTITDLDDLTGLPEYRNGGLLLDLGVLQARDRAFHTQRWTVDAEPIVEWRALTVAILDHLAEAVRGELGLSLEQFPLARVLEGGTWAAGRKIALAKRPGGVPPVLIDSDGTVF